MIYVLIGFVILFFIGLVMSESKNSNVENFGSVFVIVSTIVVVVCLFALLVAYPSSVSTIGELQAFEDGVFETYVTAVDLTEEAVVKLNMDKALLSAENIKQSSNISQRIVELRDKVTWYNETLAKYRLKNKIWWLDFFYKDVPEELTMIKLSSTSATK